jgi:hypothetical protein
LEKVEIVDLNLDNIHNHKLCGYKNAKKHEELERKISWITKRFDEGLKIKMLDAGKDGTQGMIEYLPGEVCWRPVEAKGYMFIQCIIVGYKKEYKNNGYASNLIQECIRDAKEQNMLGVAVVTRKSSFMCGKEVFIKNGFTLADDAKPDFELLVHKFEENALTVKFKSCINEVPQIYKNGVFILRADQCPYSVKNVNKMIEVAKTKYNLDVKVVNIESNEEAQKVPCAFGTFAVIINGEVKSYHPISATRFENIIKKEIERI